jgi:hypothetical protein
VYRYSIGHSWVTHVTWLQQSDPKSHCRIFASTGIWHRFSTIQTRQGQARPLARFNSFQAQCISPKVSRYPRRTRAVSTDNGSRTALLSDMGAFPITQGRTHIEPHCCHLPRSPPA